MEESIEKYIRDVKDFPKEGIMFKDITPLIGHPEGFKLAINQLLEQVDGLSIDKVVSMESRGFFFGSVLADRLNAGFVPVRKPGKLPFDTYKQEYALEYGTDTLEMHIDAIEKGEKVLIHDDVLATGGTAEAVVKMVEKAGGEIVLISFLINLAFLKGEEKIKNYNVKSLLTY
ncbi:adenine phosphoribosyltransferase [Sediminitomix flava]|uniref:Adenine phosphoribosyltransferase n=1 Tax=Sediminitomix flava TaxID=379075 RepID=A0A315ZFL3_SEDFL|nr:adenine phosphoribosyltransferase [Sediminitomix flava]PWJ43953.1 adenine phosphoribosyltransferase [Sediminitomix flava]